LSHLQVTSFLLPQDQAPGGKILFSVFLTRHECRNVTGAKLLRCNHVCRVAVPHYLKQRATVSSLLDGCQNGQAIFACPFCTVSEIVAELAPCSRYFAALFCWSGYSVGLAHGNALCSEQLKRMICRMTCLWLSHLLISL
jgi:hypothetical protein